MKRLTALILVIGGIFAALTISTSAQLPPSQWCYDHNGIDLDFYWNYNGFSYVNDGGSFGAMLATSNSGALSIANSSDLVGINSIEIDLMYQVNDLNDLLILYAYGFTYGYIPDTTGEIVQDTISISPSSATQGYSFSINYALQSNPDPDEYLHISRVRIEGWGTNPFPANTESVCDDFTPTPTWTPSPTETQELASTPTITPTPLPAENTIRFDFTQDDYDEWGVTVPANVLGSYGGAWELGTGFYSTTRIGSCPGGCYETEFIYDPPTETDFTINNVKFGIIYQQGSENGTMNHGVYFYNNLTWSPQVNIPDGTNWLEDEIIEYDGGNYTLEQIRVELDSCSGDSCADTGTAIIQWMEITFVNDPPAVPTPNPSITPTMTTTLDATQAAATDIAGTLIANATATAQVTPPACNYVETYNFTQGQQGWTDDGLGTYVTSTGWRSEDSGIDYNGLDDHQIDVRYYPTDGGNIFINSITLTLNFPDGIAAEADTGTNHITIFGNIKSYTSSSYNLHSGLSAGNYDFVFTVNELESMFNPRIYAVTDNTFYYLIEAEISFYGYDDSCPQATPTTTSTPDSTAAPLGTPVATPSYDDSDEFLADLVDTLPGMSELIPSEVGDGVSDGLSAINEGIGEAQAGLGMIDGIADAWGAAVPAPPPLMPDCINHPTDSEICAVWYILDNTLFSGLGSLYIPIIVLLLDFIIIVRIASMIITAINNVRGVVSE